MTAFTRLWTIGYPRIGPPAQHIYIYTDIYDRAYHTYNYLVPFLSK